MSNNQRIMVVDDDPDIVRIMEIYLQRWNFQPDTFTDPIYALEHFRQNSQQYLLVITDLRMPQMSGFDFARAISQARPDVKIILMTAFEIIKDELADVLPLLRYDEDILQKPFAQVQVCNAIRRKLTASC
jgi:DNA-binding NtrC family response regulator